MLAFYVAYVGFVLVHICVIVAYTFTPGSNSHLP